jgi:hypothetical protein
MRQEQLLSLRALTAVCLFTNLGTGVVSAHTPTPAAAEVQAPLQKQAERIAQGPLKLDIRPPASAIQLGDRVTVEIVLLNVDNRPAAWNQKSDLRVELTVSGRSKKPKVYPASVRPGQSSVQLTFEASEVGLLSMRVREFSDRLLPGGNSIVVRKPSTFSAVSPYGSMHLLRVALRPSPLSTFVAGAEETAPPVDEPTLLLENASRNEVLADGSDFARIKVHLMDGEAPRDIKVWVTWTDGELSPHPLIIKKGDSVAEARWVSRSRKDATLSFVSSTPKYAIEQPSELKVSFVPPIHAMVFLNLNPMKLWLTDFASIQVAFCDRQGTVVTTSRPRKLRFTSSNPTVLRMDSTEREVAQHDYSTSILVWPAWLGTSSLTVTTDGYEVLTPLQIEVSLWLVLGLCLAGGVLGGIASKKSLDKAVGWRVFGGVLGAIGLVWFCVFAVLPATSSIIAHNLVSVLVVGIVGGYGGTRVLDFLGKRLGYL